jgi:hypothetical protein
MQVALIAPARLNVLNVKMNLSLMKAYAKINVQMVKSLMEEDAYHVQMINARLVYQIQLNVSFVKILINLST